MVSHSPVTVQRMLAIVIVLLLYAPKADTAAAQAADFGFRFEVGDCLTERLDTFSGVFTKNLGGEPTETVKAQIYLTDAQMSTIYRTLHRWPVGSGGFGTPRLFGAAFFRCPGRCTE